MPITPAVQRWLGTGLALAATWPMWSAMQSVENKDYLAAVLLTALTWVVARTGLDLATVRDSDEG